MKLIYKDNNISLDFTINDKVTFIAGDSGTGKSYLFDYLKSVTQQIYNINHNGFGPDVSCNMNLEDLRFFTVGDEDKLLKDSKHYICFIDRGELFINNKIANLINECNSTIILFSRLVTGVKCRPSSYCKLEATTVNDIYCFKNVSLL